MKVGEILINVSGQDEEEIENAIALYDELKEKNLARTLFINFGNNLIDSQMVVHMFYAGFSSEMQPYYADKTNLMFYKRKKKKE